MTAERLIERLTAERYPQGFAEQVAEEVAAAGAAGELYALATGSHRTLRSTLRHRLRFRAAYVLERLYFRAPEAFDPLADDFFRRGFVACTDPSAQRHFGKIMAHLLTRRQPDAESLSRIAECAAAWAIGPAARPAVRIWAVEVLRCCRRQVPWLEEMWEDLLASVTKGGEPSIANRLRNRWN